MNLTYADLLAFIDPVVDHCQENVTRILHTESYRKSRTPNEPTILDVKGNGIEASRHWWISADGDYVDGAPLNPHFTVTDWLIGLNDDGTFALGMPQRGGLNGHGTVKVVGVRRSDGLIPDLPEDSSPEFFFSRWVKAAAWASELFPHPTDCAELVAAKLELARELSRHRHIAAVLYREGMGREWMEHLEDIRDTGDFKDLLPEPTMGTQVGGVVTVMFGTEEMDAFAPTEREGLQDLMDKSLSGRTYVHRSASVPVQFIVPTELTTEDEFIGQSHDPIISHARRHFGNYGLSLQVNTKYPVLRSLATA